MKPTNSSTVPTIAAYVLLLLVTPLLGVFDKTAAMGLTIIAGALSFAFANLDRFESFKGAGFEARLRDRLEKLDAIIEKEIEPNRDASGESGFSPPNASFVPAAVREVLSALNHHDYTWRYLGGLRESTRLDNRSIKDALDWLTQRAYARCTLGKHGDMWSLTEDGRHFAVSIDFPDRSAS